MIISRIIGGLGNQMFQYAAGRALTLELGQSLLLDISGFVGYGLHQGFEFQRVFSCPMQMAIEADIRSILGWQSAPLIRRILARPGFAGFRRQGLVVEPHFHYWQGINGVPKNSYLSGYWQSESYFHAAEQVIRSDFTFKPSFNLRNAELAEQIGQVNAISLHVRRGDYANNKKTNETHGLCSLDYYRRAIQYVAQHVAEPNFFLFSDDQSWVQEHLKIEFPCRYIDHNHGIESYNDMRLMSLCKHHIIANSSFSWWGAWLNANQSKIVVAPKKWFSSDKNTGDLLPSSWVTL